MTARDALVAVAIVAAVVYVVRRSWEQGFLYVWRFRRGARQRPGTCPACGGSSGLPPTETVSGAARSMSVCPPCAKQLRAVIRGAEW